MRRCRGLWPAGLGWWGLCATIPRPDLTEIGKLFPDGGAAEMSPEDSHPAFIHHVFYFLYSETLMSGALLTLEGIFSPKVIQFLEIANNSS